jgi:hypothetical protein
LRFFYQAVARLFTEWSNEVRPLPEAPENRDRLLNLSEAKALIPTLPNDRAKVGLASFLAILLATPIPAGTFVDALFCTRLLSVLLSHPGWIERALTGEAEKDEVYHWDD